MGPGSPRGSATAGFLGGFIAASVAALAAAWALGTFGSQDRLDTSRPAVVRHIQQLQRLETVVFGMDKIVAGGTESRFLPTFLVGDRLLLMVYGEVTAGVDLGRIAPEAVTVTGSTLSLAMPEAEVFAARIDNDRTRVYSRETGLFTRVDPNLESDVRREAERQVRQAALDSGILPVAATNARATLTAFLRGLGFGRVEFR